MSAFDTPNPVDTGEIIESYLDHLVGEDKKFNDPEALAKGKFEADKFVEDLKRQNAELREDMEKSAKLDELMELVRNQNVKPVEDPNITPVVDPNDTSSDQMAPEALKALIEDHVSERDMNASLKKNLEEADRMMMEKYGDGAARVLSQRAAEVGMSIDEIKDLASKNPKAFSRLVGIGESNKDSPTLIGNPLRSESGVHKNGEVRDAAYYKELRKKSKGMYYSPKVQMQMMKDAESMGSAFYGNNS